MIPAESVTVADGPLPGYRHVIIKYGSAAKIIIDCGAYGELGSTRKESVSSINVTTVLPPSVFAGAIREHFRSPKNHSAIGTGPSTLDIAGLPHNSG